MKKPNYLLKNPRAPGNYQPPRLGAGTVGLAPGHIKETLINIIKYNNYVNNGPITRTTKSVAQGFNKTNNSKIIIKIKYISSFNPSHILLYKYIKKIKYIDYINISPTGLINLKIKNKRYYKRNTILK